jgi:HAE1 family hydrophobic/amphiphilic exporter-1
MTTMLCILIVVAGILGYLNIPLQEQPNITYPAITITTILPGGNADTINQTLTKIIEKQMNTLPGLQTIESYSEPGKSSVTVSFKLGTDMNAAYNRLENKLNHVRDQLPKDIQPPLIELASDQDDPVIMYSLYGPQNLGQLDSFARNTIVTQLENISGVGKVMVTGASEQAVSIELNLEKMAALQISPLTVQNAFTKEHVNIPGGVVKSGKKQYTLNLDLSYHQVDELGKIIVAYRKNAPIYLKDIATVKFGFETEGSSAFFNSHPSIGINVIRQLDANTIGVIDAVKKRIAENVIPNLPTGMKLDVVYSQSNFILKIIHSLERDIWLAVLTAGLVIFLFLRSVRPTLIIVAVVPISLLGAVATIYLSGYTLNAITLLSLTILVGIVVDDSVIVLENIFRHEREDTTITHQQAAIVGANEVALPVTACSLSLVSIFLPIVFMGGVMALLFKPFAVVVTAGILISLLMSLTFNPVLCAGFLKQKAQPSKVNVFLLKCFNGLQNFYVPILKFFLRHRWIAAVIVIVMFALCVPAFKFVNKTFLPATKNTGYFTVSVQAPEGMSTDYTRERVNEAEAIIAKSPDVASIFSSTGPTANQGTISVQLKPENQLSMPQQQLMTSLNNQFTEIPGALFFVNLPDNATQITYQIRGADFNTVINLSYQLLNAIEKHPELGESYIYLANNQPQFQVFIDRVLANSLGITSYDIANILTAMSSDGVRIGYFSEGSTGERYKVLLRPQKGQFNSSDDLANIYVQAQNHQPVRLNTIVDIERSLLPSKITRTDLQYSIGFSSMPSISTNKAIALVQKLAAPILPKGYDLKLTGNTASLGSTEKNVLFTFILIIGLIYMVLASQFNSFSQPLIVMMMQPLAIVGGLFILVVTQQTLNVYSMIGILMLIGLTTKNTIMLVSLANNAMRAGTALWDAIVKVATDRMRPILMTALAMIMAQIPAIFDKGNTYRSLSLVILGGIALSSILSLIIIPSFYSLFAQIDPPKAKVKIPVANPTDSN